MEQQIREMKEYPTRPEGKRSSNLRLHLIQTHRQRSFWYRMESSSSRWTTQGLIRFY
jgi:hypothetical protein